MQMFPDGAGRKVGDGALTNAEGASHSALTEAALQKGERLRR